ncbi:MAG TPA: hypothetical protein VF681_05570 [Abditibacteriaceae bacterium]|jgi:hypothetical protein
MNFNAAHWHLLLNHIPILGVMFGAALLLYAVARRSDEVARVSLGVFILCALVVVPTYFTGEPAQASLQDATGASLPFIDRHERAAKIGTLLTLALGLTSLALLIVARRQAELPRVGSRGLLAISFCVAAWLGYVGTLGGQIRHEEIRPARQLEK